MSNDGAADIAIGVAAGVAETFTRRLVDLERDRDYWMQESLRHGKERNEALDRARKAEADLAAAQARIAEFEEEVKVLRGPDQPAPDPCPHAEGTREWAQWQMDRGRVLVCDDHYGRPLFYRIDKGVLQARGLRRTRWDTSRYRSPHEIPGLWRVLTDAEVAALTGEAQG